MINTKTKGELGRRIEYDVEHDLFHPQNVYSDEYITPTFVEYVQKLEAQIEKMKCCGNCENGELSAHEEPCRHCQRCFASADVTDQENVKDNWEAIKEIKEK